MSRPIRLLPHERQASGYLNQPTPAADVDALKRTQRKNKRRGLAAPTAAVDVTQFGTPIPADHPAARRTSLIRRDIRRMSLGDHDPRDQQPADPVQHFIPHDDKTKYYLLAKNYRDRAGMDHDARQNFHPDDLPQHLKFADQRRDQAVVSFHAARQQRALLEDKRQARRSTTPAAGGPEQQQHYGGNTQRGSGGYRNEDQHQQFHRRQSFGGRPSAGPPGLGADPYATARGTWGRA